MNNSLSDIKCKTIKNQHTGIILGNRGSYAHALGPVHGHFLYDPGARFSKVPMINGPGKLSPFTLKIEVSIVLHPIR